MEECPLGHECKGGVGLLIYDITQTQISPTRCALGKYANKTGLSSCESCPGGSECLNPLGTIQPVVCSVGKYRDNRLSFIECQECPKGFYNNQLGKSRKDECVPCPAGLFCDVQGLADPYTPEKMPDCPEKYYCTAGTNQARLSSQECPSKKFCMSG
jgi:hypothetical protein